MLYPNFGPQIQTPPIHSTPLPSFLCGLADHGLNSLMFENNTSLNLQVTSRSCCLRTYPKRFRHLFSIYRRRIHPSIHPSIHSFIHSFIHCVVFSKQWLAPWTLTHVHYGHCGGWNCTLEYSTHKFISGRKNENCLLQLSTHPHLHQHFTTISLPICSQVTENFCSKE